MAEAKSGAGESKQADPDFFQERNAPPEWLNKDYLEKIFRQHEKDQSLQITECDIIPATKVGDNFASEVFRAKLSYTIKEKTVTTSVIIKIRPYQDGPRKDFMAGVPLFKTESDIYVKVLPEMQRLLQKLGDNDIISPKLIHSNHSNKDHDVLILEDIAPQGYKMRHKALDLENTKKVIQKLAKFHAVSYYMYHDEKRELDDFKFGLITTGTMKEMGFFEEGYMRAVRCVKEWEGFGEIAEKMEKFGPHLLRKIREIYIADKSAFNVLNHGDFHIKNLLFIDNANDDIEKISFIDFQISVWATPAVDLNYALYVNASTETRENHRDELIRYYHTTFCSILQELGCMKKAPSLLDLNIEMLKHGVIEIILACQFMAMFYMTFDNLSEEEKKNYDLLSKRLYNTTGMRPVLEKLFVHCLNKGYFEI